MAELRHSRGPDDQTEIRVDTLASWASRLCREEREADAPAFVGVAVDDDDRLDDDIAQLVSVDPAGVECE